MFMLSPITQVSLWHLSAQPARDPPSWSDASPNLRASYLSTLPRSNCACRTRRRWPVLAPNRSRSPTLPHTPHPSVRATCTVTGSSPVRSSSRPHTRRCPRWGLLWPDSETCLLLWTEMALFVTAHERVPAQPHDLGIQPGRIQSPITHHDHCPVLRHTAGELLKQLEPVWFPSSLLLSAHHFPGHWKSTAPIHHADAPTRAGCVAKNCHRAQPVGLTMRGVNKGAILSQPHSRSATSSRIGHTPVSCGPTR